MESRQQPRTRAYQLTTEEIQREQALFMTQVYGWMAVALLITSSVSIWTASTPALLQVIVGNRFVFYGLILAELGLVVWLSAAIQRVSAGTATAMFLGYAVLNGLTLAIIFMVFTGGSIASTFFVTAGMFGTMSAYGYFTQRDLTSWGNMLFMALIGLILASVVNLFFHNTVLYWITSFAGVLIFVGLTAYDTQKIKEMFVLGGAGTEEDRKVSIMGALRLYLDFVNLFLYLLRFMGRRK